MSKHNRHPDYWKYYHMAHVREGPFLIETIAGMVRRHPSPRPHVGRGRPPVYSKKMDFVCVLMAARNVSSRDREGEMQTRDTQPKSSAMTRRPPYR